MNLVVDAVGLDWNDLDQVELGSVGLNFQLTLVIYNHKNQLKVQISSSKLNM